MLKIKLESISFFFAKSTVIFFIAAFHLNYFVEGIFGFTGFRNNMLLLGLILYIIKLVFKPKIEANIFFITYVLILIPIAIISTLFWTSLSEINVYLCLITTLILISCDFNYLKKVLKTLTYIILILAIYEKLSGEYVFSVIRMTEWGVKPLDEKFFGGFSGILRTKAIFEGPLALAQYAIGIAVLFRKNIKLILIAIVLSFLANGRLGIIICSFVLIIYFFEKYSIIEFFMSKKGILTIFVSSIILIIISNFLVNKKSLDRLQAAFDYSDNSNEGRFYYWQKAIDMFIDYDFVYKIFGNSGYYREIVGNSAENGWLMLMLNNGLLGFAYYLIPFIIIIFFSLKAKSFHTFYLLLIIFAMMVQTFNLGASASIFFWLILYSFFIELINKKNHV